MQITAYSDFSLRVLMHAALNNERRVTVDEVADTYGISRNHLVKIVHELGRSGYLKTQRGIGGGFKLARPADKIRIGDIVRLSEKTATVIECNSRREGPCRLRHVCRIKGILNEAAAAFFHVLDGYTLADLVAEPAALRSALAL